MSRYILVLLNFQENIVKRSLFNINNGRAIVHTLLMDDFSYSYRIMAETVWGQTLITREEIGM